MFKKKKNKTVELYLNARLQPKHRFPIEDALEEKMQEKNIGIVAGGGTYQFETGGEISGCDIVIEMENENKIKELLKIIEEMKFPKESFLQFGKEKIEVGSQEGLAIYVRTDLPEEVYENGDINYVIEKLEELMGEDGELYSWYESANDIALYFYGESFDKMNQDIASFITEFPVCKDCKVLKIA